MNTLSISGWSDVLITTAAEVTLGKTPRKTDYTSEGSHRVIKYRDLQNNKLALNETKDGFARSDPGLLRSLRQVFVGDVLIGASGHSSESIGRKVAIVHELPPGGPHYFAGELLGIRPDPAKLDGRWAKYFFSSEDGFSRLQGAVSGVHITNGRARQMTIPLPPVPEQQRICDLLDAADEFSRSAQARFHTARHRLERFRQAILAAACSGRLTADWREQTYVLDGKPLVAAIQEARRGHLKVIEPEEIGAPDGEVTPDGWTWVTFGSVIGELRNGVPIAPAMEPPGVPILRISAARPRSVDLTDLRYLRDESDKWTSFKLRDGDLLFTRYNGSLALLGVCGMVRGLGDRAVLHPDKLMKVRFDHQFVEPEYAEIFFSGPMARSRMTAKSVSSAGQQGVSGATVKAQPFALPPLEEQRTVIARVNLLLRRADELEARIAAAARCIDGSSQAVLAKAFRGELVGRVGTS